ncbi:MAG: dihydrofolate reductase family protein [Ornithinibacter sp.]
MGKVVSSAMMSLDGYIAKADDTIGRLFDCLDNGDVELPTATPGMTFHMTPRSAEYWRAWVDSVGAIVVGRTLFDVADGWGGRHTMGAPVVVVTHEVPTEWVDDHPGAELTFVTDGVESAIATAQDIAGDQVVAVAAGTIARQCLELGLLDEVAVDLVPVVMGQGKPYFGAMGITDVMLGDPTTCLQGERVTHLVFPVQR